MIKMTVWKNKNKKKNKVSTGTYSTSISVGNSGSYNKWEPLSVSSNSISWGSATWSQPRNNIDLNNTDFTFELLDGIQKTLTAKEYFDFIAYNGMTPGDCKDEEEYKEKIIAIKL